MSTRVGRFSFLISRNILKVGSRFYAAYRLGFSVRLLFAVSGMDVAMLPGALLWLPQSSGWRGVLSLRSQPQSHRHVRPHQARGPPEFTLQDHPSSACSRAHIHRGLNDYNPVRCLATNFRYIRCRTNERGSEFRGSLICTPSRHSVYPPVSSPTCRPG